MIVIMAGLPGSGKTTLAREMAARCGGRVIGKDEIRHAVFAEHEIEYSSRQDDFSMLIMLQVTGYLLRRNRERIVFLDGRPFSRRYQIENVLRAAESLHQEWRIIECVCSEETAGQRLLKQAAAAEHPAGNRDFDLYREVKARFEAITLAKSVIDTGQPLADCVELGLAALR